MTPAPLHAPRGRRRAAVPTGPPGPRCSTPARSRWSAAGLRRTAAAPSRCAAAATRRGRSPTRHVQTSRAPCTSAPGSNTNPGGRAPVRWQCCSARLLRRGHPWPPGSSHVRCTPRQTLRPMPRPGRSRSWRGPARPALRRRRPVPRMPARRCSGAGWPHHTGPLRASGRPWPCTLPPGLCVPCDFAPRATPPSGGRPPPARRRPCPGRPGRAPGRARRCTGSPSPPA